VTVDGSLGMIAGCQLGVAAIARVTNERGVATKPLWE